MRNLSAFTATGVTIVDSVAPNTGIIEYVASASPRFISQGTVTGEHTGGFTWNVGNLGPAGSGTDVARLQFQAEAVRTGDDVNRAIMSADQLSGVAVEDEPTTVSP